MNPLKDSERDIEILDTTLRDGSYANNFQFTPGQTQALCRELEAAGIKFIEVGHGLGLNAGNSDYPTAVASDEEYMLAASEACEEALWGIFCIPGIARPQDVKLAGAQGADFIRIGTNITEVEESKEFVEIAKEEGMFVTANYMKSYARSPAILADKVEMSEKYGVDMIYIVDSAGGMVPESILEYYRYVRDVSDIPIGFHGHDNLGLAVANSLEMAKAGVDVIDTSLQGLGRSAGNAGTEKTVAVLEKTEFNTGTDFLRLVRTGQKFVSPIRSNPSQAPLAVVGGQVEFHSSHMAKILDSAYKYGVDPARLIQEVCEQNKIYAPQSLIDRLAEQLQEERQNGRIEDYGVSHYPGGEEDI